jgi:hypothetical protein
MFVRLTFAAGIAFFISEGLSLLKSIRTISNTRKRATAVQNEHAQLISNLAMVRPGLLSLLVFFLAGAFASRAGWGRGDAIYACDFRTGNCSDFHAYFIALARSIGIPARFAIGATIPADTNEGTIEGYHCWAEFLADGRWVPVDISEAWKNRKLADYYFGHNPANRFELTKGRDLVVDPEPASGPINFLAYPLLEMNGEIVKPETTFTFRRVGG